mgnify:CR=1 FL=1
MACHIAVTPATVVKAVQPVVPSALLALDNVVLTPHSAGRSPEAVSATVALFLENAGAHFAGQAVLTPVPPPRG